MFNALRILVDHAREAYPHFESERGQEDIARADAALRLGIGIRRQKANDDLSKV